MPATPHSSAPRSDLDGRGLPAGPNPRMVAATAMPMASSVITVNAPLATDFSAATA